MRKKTQSKIILPTNVNLLAKNLIKKELEAAQKECDDNVFKVVDGKVTLGDQADIDDCVEDHIKVATYGEKVSNYTPYR